MKFKLICEHEEGDMITYEFNKVFLGDVVERMQDFLKGCGFVFDGTLDIVCEDEFENKETTDETVETNLDPFNLKEPREPEFDYR